MKPIAWNQNWPSEVEQAIAHLESAVEGNARAAWSLNPFAGRPVDTPHQHVMVAQSYMSNLNFRLAIREYEKILAASPELADPHWGIAVSLYNLAILDMLVRGLCKTSKSDIRFVARRMIEESYLRRETKVLAQGALTFASVGRAMWEQGWQPRELVGGIGVVLGQNPGLIPDARQGADISRASLPTELVPLATFSPDDAARVLLELSDQQFLAGNMYGQIKVTPNVLNFFDYEMRSVQGRVQELLRAASAGVSLDRERLSHLRARFDKVRGESDIAFELFAGFRITALRGRDPAACVHAGAMFLAGAFYTVAEEMFQKALELLPASTEALWGLAQTYYGLALFDMLERDQFDITWYETNPALVSRIRIAPLKYDTVAMLNLATTGALKRAFTTRGLIHSELGRLLSLLGIEQPASLPKAVPLPIWRPDAETQALCQLALDYAERARHSSQLPEATNVVAFNPADLEAFYAHLVACSGTHCRTLLRWPRRQPVQTC